MRSRVGAVSAAFGWLAVIGALAAGCSATDAVGPASSAPRSTVTHTRPAELTSTAVQPSSSRLTGPPAATITTTVRSTVYDSTVTNTSLVTTTFAPPPATREPAAVAGDCPYISLDDVSDINGQRPGPTQLIATTPYPICIFHRSDGGYMATIRIVVAATPAAAAAAVDQHVPVSDSFPASQPPGWSGGAMPTPDGIAGNADVRSIYAVSKGKIAIVAESNQDQTVKGRQMVIDVVAALKL